MKSWFLKNNELGRSFELRDIPFPSPKPKEIIVKVYAAALNRGEFLAKDMAAGDSEFKSCGIECAGEIVDIGESVKGYALGDRIMGRAKMAFSEYAIIQEGNALAVPDRFGWDEAACASITYQTAYDMLWLGARLQANEWLLVTGITSGVGLAALQLAKLLGSKVIGTSRSKNKLEELKEYGLDYSLIFPSKSLGQQVPEITNGHGIDVIVNNIGASVFDSCVQVLAYRGRLATVGLVDGERFGKIDLSLQHKKRLKFFGVSNKMRSEEEIFKLVKQFKDDIYPAFNKGSIRPVVNRTFKFEELPMAADLMVSNMHLGKIVINV